MMRKILLAGLFLSVFFTLNAGDVPEEKKESIQAMPPVSWLDAPVRVDLGIAPGDSDSEFPQMAVNGNDVGVVWTDFRNGFTDILFNRSRDRGATWRKSPLRLDTGDVPGAHGSWDPKMCRSGNHIYVVWSDERNGMADIYFNRSTDGGDTWMPLPVRLDTGTAPGYAGSWVPEICCDGLRVYVVWIDEREGWNHTYFNRSLDGGETWLAADRQLDTADPTKGAVLPQIACSGDNVYVTWMDDRIIETNAVYFKYSHDAGAAWQATEVRLDNDESASLFPQIACSGNYVYVAWISLDLMNFYDSGVSINRSADRGVSWLNAPVRADVSGSLIPSFLTEPPAIQCSGADVAVVWRTIQLMESPNAIQHTIRSSSGSRRRGGKPDFRLDLKTSPAALPLASHVLFNRSQDGGLTWQPVDTQLNTNTGISTTGLMIWNLNSLGFCSQGDHFHVAWTAAESESEFEDVFFNHSSDRGTSWQAAELRLDTGDAPGTNESLFPAIACTADNVFVAWMDDRDGDFDIHYSTTEAPPRADAGSGGETRLERAFSLDGGGSSDPDGDGLAYLWSLREQPSGSTATIDNHRSRIASLVPDREGEYVIQLTVTDPFGRSDTDRVTVTALDLVDLTLSAGSGGTTIPAPGIHTYRRGETVAIKAVPDANFLFAGWSGDAAGAANPLELVMDDDKAVTATFVPVVLPPLNLSGERIENRSLSMVEYIARLTWAAHPDNYDTTGYRIVRVESGNEMELAVVGSDTFAYEERGVSREGTLTYRVYTLRSDGFWSDPAEVIIN